jgi:hypothetical protein
MGRGVLLLVVLCGLLAGASSAHAQTPEQTQMYRWQDEHGQMYFTDDPSSVPARFRPVLEKVALPEPTYAPDRSSEAGSAQSSQAPARPANGEMAKAVAEAVGQSWPDLPASKRQAVANLIVDRLLLLLVAAGIHTLVTLALFGHSVVNRRVLWAAGNLLLFFVPPLYVLLALETDAVRKVLILVAWATGPAAGVALHLAVAGMVA